jgi:hypothetical protein
MTYKTDLIDEEWDLIKKDFEPASKRGNGHKHSKKSIVNAILYIVKGGIGVWGATERLWEASHNRSVVPKTPTAVGTTGLVLIAQAKQLFIRLHVARILVVTL